MNSLGLNLIMRSGCLCSKERIEINGKRYYIRDRIAQGGFSTVELVEDSRSHQLYALKRVICHGQEDQRIALAEVEYHKILQHPGILEMFDYDLKERRDSFINNDDSSEVLLVLKYHSRGTIGSELERREKKRNFLSEKEIIKLFLSICEGVSVFHSAQPNALAHRDIKTSNILLDDNNNPIIMDLGSVARARLEIKDNTEAKRIEETAAERSSMPYRAPEFFNIPSIFNIDERSDIWSLGCLLFALCFFKSPFDFVYERGDSVPLAVINGKIDIPSSSPFSEDIHDLIKFILKVDPKDRPFINELISKVKILDSKLQGCI